MAITYTPISSADYLPRLQDFIKTVEGEKYTPYVDTKGVATIGWGFALNKVNAKPGVVDDYLGEVLKFNVAGLSTGALQREAYYANMIKALLDIKWTPDIKGTASSDLLYANLNLVLQMRADEITAGTNYSAPDQKLLAGKIKTDFKYDALNQIEDTFDIVKKSLDTTLKNIFDKIPESNERMAIFSALYQGTIGGDDRVNSHRKAALVNALKNSSAADGRAEVWYILRYVRNGEPYRGYMESAMFGLYDSGEVKEDGAKAAYRMLTLHRKEIFAYDEKNDAARIDANNKFKKEASISSFESKKLLDSFIPARDALISFLNKDAAYSGLDLIAANYLATDIYIDPGRKNSLETIAESHSHDLDARKKADGKTENLANNILIGEKGMDTLIGGKGKDVLFGGEGADAYIFESGDGQDKIKDGDGGFVLRDSHYLARGEWIGAGHWIAKDENGQTAITYKDLGSGLLQITFTGGDAILIYGFKFADAFTKGLTPGARTNSFGIELEFPEKVALVEGTDLRHNPALDGDTQTTTRTVATTLAEGGTKMFTVHVSDASNQNRTLRISLTGIDLTKFALSTGVAQYNFSGGSVTLTLAAGETSFTFALVNTGDTDQNGQLNLTAKVLETGKDTIDSNLARIAYTSVVEQNTPFLHRVIDGDADHRAFNYGVNPETDFPNDKGWNERAYFDMGGGNDFVEYGTSGDEIHGGAGNDQILSKANAVQNGELLIHGDEGNDWLEYANGGRGGKLYGDAGNDVIGHFWVGSEFFYVKNPVGEPGPVARWDTWDVIWKAISSTWQPTFEAGKIISNGSSVGFDGGSWDIELDSGNRTLKPRAEFGIKPTGQVTVEGVTYTYTFTFGGGLSGTLDLKWREGKKDYEATLSIGEYLTAPIRGTGALMDGGEGNDCIIGVDGGNTLVGGAGNDLIQGGAGIDRAYGDGGPEGNLSQAGYGNDQIALGDSNDYADGGDGDDIIIGEAGADTLFGGRDDDYMVAGKWGTLKPDIGDGDYLDGEDGNDTLFGSGGNDTLIGGAGNDYFQGEWGNVKVFGDDFLDGGEGEDRIWGSGGSDILYGGAGNDAVNGDAIGIAEAAYGDDKLYGEAGNDTLNGHAGDDRLFGGANDDQLDGGKGEDLLDGGMGDDVLLGQEGKDLLAGGQGRDQLQGGLGDDIYQLELGDSLAGQIDTIEDNEGENTLRFGGGIRVEDIVISANGSLANIKYSADDTIAVKNGLTNAIAWVEFADGSRHSIAELVGNSTTPLAGTDKNGNSVQFGGKTEDRLTSNTGRATISGGKGSDVLMGSGGNNTYLYSIGDGADLLVENNDAPNRIRFGQGIRADDVRIRYNESNVLTLQIGDKAGDSIRIQGFNPAKALENPPIDFYEFADGTVLAHAELLEQGFDVNGTAENDDLAGTSVNDRLNGGAGNDVLRGGAGDDVYYFSAGGGRDTVVDALGANRVVFGAGLKAQGLKVSQRTDATGRYLDLAFATGERLSVQNGELGGVQFFEFADGSWLSSEDLLRRLPRVDLHGTAGDDTLTGYDGNDTLLGFGVEDALSGGAGNDVLDGGQGDDILRGGTGTDIYTFARLGGQDTLIESGTQANTIKLGADLTLGMVRWRQSSNNLVLSLSGSDDNVTLKDYFAAGGAKNWRVVEPGGQASTVAQLIQRPDPYGKNKILGLMDEFKQSAWQDLLEEKRDDGFAYQGGGKFYKEFMDTAHFFRVWKQSFSRWDAWEDESGQTVYIANFRLALYEKYPDFNSTSSRIKQEDFHQYTKQTERSNAAEIVVRGTSAEKTELDKVLVTFRDHEKWDYSQWWERGLNSLFESYTLETHVSNISYDMSQVTPQDWTGETLMSGNRAVLSASKVYRDQTYLTELTAGAGHNRIIVETLALVDGGAGNDTIIEWGGYGFFYGNTGSDTISGFNSTLAGGDGNDKLTGSGCTFIGGKGSDVMLGEGGDNRYIVLDKGEVGVKLIADSGGDLDAYADWYFGQHLGYSHWPGGDLDKWVIDDSDFGRETFGSYKGLLAFRDSLEPGHWLKESTIAELKASGTLRRPLPSVFVNDYLKIEALIAQGAMVADVVELPTGVTRSSLSFAWGKAEHEGAKRTTLDVSWDGELRMQIVMPTERSEMGFGIEQFKLADGSVLTMCEAIAGLAPLPGSRVTYGSSSEDTITGANGNRLIYGLGADDSLSGGNGAHSLRGGSGDDRLQGGAGDDVLIGGAGKDEMVGGTGLDSFTGGKGRDRLKGGVGDDTYFLRRGDGRDTIFDKDKTAGNTDAASFAANIRSDQLWFRKLDDDLEVRVIGTGDRFTIQSWYDGAKYHVEQFRTADGQVLLDTQVDALVQAMAGFAPPAAGQTTLPKAYQDALGGVIAANWQ